MTESEKLPDSAKKEKFEAVSLGFHLGLEYAIDVIHGSETLQEAESKLLLRMSKGGVSVPLDIWEPIEKDQ